MAQTHKRLGRTTPAAATNTTSYTAPASTKALITSIIVSNTGAAAETMRIFAVPSGGSAGVTNALYYDVPVPDNDTFVANIAVLLETGDFLVVYSLGGALTFTTSGIEIT